MNRYTSIAALLCATVVSACSKDGVQEIAAPATSGAFVRFFNFGVGAPAVNFYANDAKLTAISSTTGAESTNGVAYGGAGSGGWYSNIAAGQYTLTGKISATADKDLVVASVAAPLADGKFYSFFMSGAYSTATKKVEAFVVEDPFSMTIDYTVAYVRFVNASANSSPMTLYGRNTSTGAAETAIGTAVAYKSAGAFVAVPPGVYDLSTRVTGSSTNTISRAAVSFSAGHVFTIAARGTIGGTGTAAPALDNTAHR
jgi:hypothetical protein